MISIIMPCWIINDELYNLTDKAFASIFNSEGYDCELIIIDNASPLGGDQLSTIADVYVRNRKNLGYPKAVNQGLALAHGDLVVVANNDIRVSPNWITVTKEVFSRLDNIGSLHFRMVGYDAPFGLQGDVWDHGKELWCHGSFFVWNKKAIDQIGGMDEHYGLGGYDDYDWQHRMRHLRGWKTAYTNAAAFQHRDSSSQLLRDSKERSETDKKNYELFKLKFDEYPDVMWKRMYPKQFAKGWLPFP